MLWGILLIGFMIRYEWKRIDEEQSEGSRFVLRIIAIGIAVLLMGGSFLAAVLIGAVWGYIVGAIFRAIRKSRETSNGNHFGGNPQPPALREYLVNGQGEVTGKVFDPRQYRGYTVVESDLQGRVLADSTGKIICTRYVRM